VFCRRDQPPADLSAFLADAFSPRTRIVGEANTSTVESLFYLSVAAQLELRHHRRRHFRGSCLEILGNR
jgi:hypothetical protein